MRFELRSLEHETTKKVEHKNETSSNNGKTLSVRTTYDSRGHLYSGPRKVNIAPPFLLHTTVLRRLALDELLVVERRRRVAYTRRLVVLADQVADKCVRPEKYGGVTEWANPGATTHIVLRIAFLFNERHDALCGAEWIKSRNESTCAQLSKTSEAATDSDSGTILRFFRIRSRSQNFVKKRTRSRILFSAAAGVCVFFTSVFDCKHCWISDAWNINRFRSLNRSRILKFEQNLRPGFKKFGTGADSEWENVSPATSAWHLNDANGPNLELCTAFDFNVLFSAGTHQASTRYSQGSN